MNNARMVTKSPGAADMTRRSFVKWMGVVGGAAALAGGGLSLGFRSAQAEAAGSQPVLSGVTIVPSGCAHNCGGRCVLKAWVKEGVIERITTDDRPDTPADPQLRACPRGRSYRRRVYHPDRLKYPMKRVGERGEGKFERISWDEAAETVAREMQRVKETHGNSAFYNHYASGGGSLFAGRVMSQRLLNLFGGSLNYYNSYSSACYSWMLPRLFGAGATPGNSRDDWKNARLMLFFGFNPAEMIWGTNTHYYIKQARQQGTKVILVDPRLSMTAQALVDEWIPIRPGTDAALIAAMAYVMITEGLQDQGFLDRYTVGFDEEHLPPGAPAGSSYKSYVLGISDGVPKTPEWAEQYTQIPAERIVKLAREVALTKPAMVIQGWGPQRRAYGEAFVHAVFMLAAMTGNLGRSGSASGAGGGVSRTVVGSMPSPPNPIKESIPVFRWTDAIVRGTEMGPADGVINLPPGQPTLRSNIKFIFNTGGNTLVNQHSNIRRTDRILRDTSLVEFIVVADQFMTPSARYADILLPAVTWFEKNDLCTTWVIGDSLIFMNKAIEPMYECKTDYEIFALIAEKLGLGEAFTEGKTELQWLEEMVRVSQQKDPTFPTFDEFRKKGVHIFALDDPPVIGLKAFIDNPEANPLRTPTGKVELFSTAILELQRQGLVDPDQMPAIPKFVPEWEGGPWDPLFAKYPLQAMGHHYHRRSHSTYDNIDWLDEAMPQRVFMNPLDAEARGIRDGDRVRVYNDRGEMIIPVRVTPRIMPGQVDIPQGAWWTPDATGVDRRGSINVLTSERPTPGARGNPQHTNLVQVEKA